MATKSHEKTRTLCSDCTPVGEDEPQKVEQGMLKEEGEMATKSREKTLELGAD